RDGEAEAWRPPRWGRHLRSGPATAAKATFALTQPSNLLETRARTISTAARGSHAHGGGGASRGTAGRPNALGLEHTAIAQQRIEDAGEATGEGDDGDVFAAARGDAQGPGLYLLGRRRLRAGGSRR